MSDWPGEMETIINQLLSCEGPGTFKRNSPPLANAKHAHKHNHLLASIGKSKSPRTMAIFRHVDGS